VNPNLEQSANPVEEGAPAGEVAKRISEVEVESDEESVEVKSVSLAGVILKSCTISGKITDRSSTVVEFSSVAFSGKGGGVGSVGSVSLISVKL